MEATMISTDRIEQEIRLTATRTRVWRALTIPTQFGKWFGVALSGDSVKPGMVLRGTKLSQGCGDNTFEATVEEVQPESRFSLRWHPYSTEPVIDFDKDPTTLITFTLTDVPGGTLLSVVETGFDKLPATRRALAFDKHTQGWDAQLKNVAKHLAAT